MKRTKNQDKNRRTAFDKHREQLLAELKKNYPNYNLKSSLLGALFLLGLALTIWEINIYESTFISLYIPLNIWLLTGVIMTPIFKKTFNIYCFNPYTPGSTHLAFHYLFNIVSFGGIMMFLFIWTNYTFKDKSSAVFSAPIISNGYLAESSWGCGNPYVHIIYKGEEKELIFPCSIPVEKYSRVNIAVAKGRFGFDVITEKRLEE